MKNTRSAKIVEKPAGEIVMQLAAMANFPGERAAVEALARALERSACDSGMTMQAIVDECLNGGAFCPTPFDLRNLAMGMKKLAREKREGSIHAKWREQYGEPNPQWGSDLLAQLIAPTPAEQRAKLHERAIRDMLYYTEGDGQELGDRAFWAYARKHDLRGHAALVEAIRARGGWRTARDLAGALEIPQEQPAKQLEFDGRAAGANDPPF